MIALMSIVGIGFAITFDPAEMVGNQQKRNDTLIAEKMAWHIGMQAYVYGYPLVDMYR